MVKIARDQILSRQSEIILEVPIIIYLKTKRIRKEKEKDRVAGVSDNKRTECTPRKCFRCGSEDPLIAKFPKPPKYNEKWQKQIRFSERCNHASQK